MDADAFDESTLDPGEAFRATGHRVLDDTIDFLRDVRARPAWRKPTDAARARLGTHLPVEPGRGRVGRGKRRERPLVEEIARSEKQQATALGIDDGEAGAVTFVQRFSSDGVAERGVARAREPR